MSGRSSLHSVNPFQTQAFSFTGAGSTTIVPGQVNKIINIWRMKMKVGGATNVTIEDTNGNVFDGPIPFQSGNEGWILDFITFDCPPWYQTAPGAGFVISLSAAVLCGGSVEYLPAGLP